MSYAKDGRWCVCKIDGESMLFWVEDAIYKADLVSLNRIADLHNRALAVGDERIKAAKAALEGEQP